MKEIPLTQNQVVLVSDKDYDWLNTVKWYAAWCSVRHGFYAKRNGYINSKRRSILMHRLIMNAQPGQQIDHIDHNLLNDQRENLRFCTSSQNCCNRKPYHGCSSIYKGVSWYRHRKWMAYIKLNGCQQYLGYFVSETDAALAYNVAARKYFGEFAFCNEIQNREI